ncbi:hypothetical protein PMI06_008721 [Burkholderia sp. BT03]|nr:hypothetical protein [Paraburkholderia hospita]EUC12338.1 hypothetical protein PMI06_008721 [Burkholderia sp. BT03]
MVVQAKLRQRQGVWTIKELKRAVAMSAVTPAADDELVHVCVGPAHGELRHVVQLRNRDPFRNQESPPDQRADAAQTDSQLKRGLRFGRVGVHRVTINFPFSHIRRPDCIPRFGAISDYKVVAMVTDSTGSDYLLQKGIAVIRCKEVVKEFEERSRLWVLTGSKGPDNNIHPPVAGRYRGSPCSQTVLRTLAAQGRAESCDVVIGAFVDDGQTITNRAVAASRPCNTVAKNVSANSQNEIPNT